MQTELEILVKRHKSGDKTASEELARRAAASALRTAAAITGSREFAGDVSQEVAIRALRSAGTLRSADQFDAWVHRITVNETRRALAKLKRHQSRTVSMDLLELDSSEAASVSPRTSADSASAELVAALEQLPDRQRIAIALKYVHDLSDEQVAKALRCRPGTVRSLLSRGREAMRMNPNLQEFQPISTEVTD